MVYSLFPQDGDGEIVIRNLNVANDVRKVSVGALPPTPETNNENPEAPTQPPNVRILLTSDGKYAVLRRTRRRRKPRREGGS